jgi:hypothetical protein
VARRGSDATGFLRRQSKAGIRRGGQKESDRTCAHLWKESETADNPRPARVLFSQGRVTLLAGFDRRGVTAYFSTGVFPGRLTHFRTLERSLTAGWIELLRTASQFPSLYGFRISPSSSCFPTSELLMGAS